MQLFALGLNHHTAPLAIRERVAFQPERMGQALHDLAHTDSVREAAILSTCNRTELYFAAEQPQHAADWLARFHRLALAEVSPYLYSYPQRDAIRHVFRVASGLDSMVIGEPQILGQVKDAARYAEEAGTLGVLLHKLFQNTFAVAKEVRSTTAIGANTVSMAAAAVHLTERIFERVSDQHVLFIGAGEMIELCAAHFGGARPKSMTVANRTEERAKALADRFGASTMRIDQIGDALPRFDVVVSCTAAPLPIVGLGINRRLPAVIQVNGNVLTDGRGGNIVLNNYIGCAGGGVADCICDGKGDPAVTDRGVDAGHFGYVQVHVSDTAVIQGAVVDLSGGNDGASVGVQFHGDVLANRGGGDLIHHCNHGRTGTGVA